MQTNLTRSNVFRRVSRSAGHFELGMFVMHRTWTQEALQSARWAKRAGKPLELARARRNAAEARDWLAKYMIATAPRA